MYVEWGKCGYEDNCKGSINLSGMSMLLSRETCRQLYDVLVDLMLERPDIPQTGPSMG